MAAKRKGHLDGETEIEQRRSDVSLRVSPVKPCPLCGKDPRRVEPAGNRAALVRCQSCGLVFAASGATTADLYERAYGSDAHQYAEYHDLAKKAHRGEIRETWAMRHFFRKTAASGLLLDVGCSTGSFLFAARQRGWKVAGVEISPSAAHVARELTGAAITVGTVTDHVVNITYDAVTAWEVLEHVTEPRAFVAACVDLLAPGGALAISVPNWRSPWMRNSPHSEHWPPFHLSYWERETLSYLFHQAGLDRIVVLEKPFAWEEEVGWAKWLYLPVALVRSALLGAKGMHLFAMGWKR